MPMASGAANCWFLAEKGDVGPTAFLVFGGLRFSTELKGFGGSTPAPSWV